MLTIIHLIDNLERGGAQTRLLNDIRYLPTKEFRNVVCALYGRGELARECAAYKAEVHTLNMKSAFDSKGMATLKIILKNTQADVLHTQLFFADIIGRSFGYLTRTPNIVTTIQSSAYEPGTSLYSGKRRILDSITGKLCNTRFIAVSNFVKKSLIKRLGWPDQKIDVIPNYVDTNTCALISREKIIELRNELHIQPDTFIFITIGRLNHAKGHHHIIRALSKVKDHHTNFVLLILGDGQDKDTLSKLADEYAIVQHIRFLGERSDVHELLGMSDAFVFLSESEGLPLVVLEAMGMAKPCILSDIGPHREIVTSVDQGLIVDHTNPDSVASILLTIIRDSSLRTKLASAGKKQVFDNFSQNVNVKRLENLYHDVVNNHKKNV